MEAPSTEDPWDWSIDQVVEALCNPTSAWMRLLETRSVDDTAFLEQALRANKVEGDSLLTSVDQVSLRDDYGIKAHGPRGRLMIMITKLRVRSPKYLDYIQEKAWDTPLPRHESNLGRSSASGFGSQYVDPPIHFAARYTSASNGFLQSPMLSPHRQQLGRLEVATPDESPVQARRSSNQPQGDILVRNSEPLVPRTPLSDPPREEEPQHPSDTSAITDETFVAVTANQFDKHRQTTTDNGMSALEIDSVPAASLNVARCGETYVVDESGRKRRRLVLTTVNTQEAASTDQGILAGTHGQITVPSDSHSKTLDVNNDHEGDHDQLEDASNAGKKMTARVGEVIKSLANEIPSIPQAVVPPEPGKLIIDAQGRKRMRPLLVLEPDVCEDRPIVPKALDSSTIHYGRPASQTYLGPKALAVEDVFYSDTPLGQELRNEVQYNIPAGTHRQTEPETYAFVSDNTCGDGQRRYVHNLIRPFLYSRELMLLRQKGQLCVADIPYHSRIGKKHQPQSLTLFSKSSGNVVALRVDRSKWIKDRLLPAPKLGTPHDNGDFVNHFGVPEDHPFTIEIGSNEIHDWDFLEKWRYQEHADKILPLYGESGSEGEYDLDTWQEMEDEGEAIVRPLGRSKSRHLDSKEVLAIIDVTIEDVIARWKETKLPRLQPRARRMWLKSRRDKTKREQIKNALDLITDRDKRLTKLKQAIAEEMWSSQPQVKKQCKCMQETIFEREELRWKVSVWESRRVPPKPIMGSEKASKPRMEASTYDSLGDDEEDLISTGSAPETSDDEGLYDFIVSDEDIEDTIPISNGLTLPQTVDEQQSGPDGYDAMEEDSDDDEIVTTLAQRRRRHQEAEDMTIAVNAALSTAPAPQLGDHFPESAQDVMIIPSSSEGADPLSSDKVSSSSSPIFQSKTPSPHNPPSSPTFHRRLPVLDNEIIDLTQMSDPVVLPTPKPKRESPLDIRTPPLLSEDDDPFRRNRKKETKFNPPPANENIIDLESESSQSTSREEDALVSSEDLPDLRQVKKIARLSANFLIERQDRKRLLIWVIARTPSSERESVLVRTRGVAMDVNQSGVVSALKALKAHSLRIRGEDRLSSDVLMRIATWYVIWSQCVRPNPKHGISIRHIEQTLQDMEGFDQFYEFLVECLKRYEVPSLSTTPERSISGKGDSGGLDPQRQKRVLNDPFDGGHVFTPHKKRKYQVQESQEARDIRQTAQQRVRERDARQRELKRQLEKKGLNDEDSCSMIINAGKLNDQNFVFLNPKIAARIQPHQKEGVQFMWRELVTDDKSLQGCLLAHTMGLGKTMQVISFLVTVAEAAKSTDENIRNQLPPGLRESRTLILCPPSLIDNWWEEFLMWTPDPMTDNIGELRKVTSSLKLAERVFEIFEWAKEGGVLLIGYSTFRDLIANKSRTGKKDKTIAQIEDEEDENQKATPLKEDKHREVLRALLQLPNIIVADEAHAIKNHASILTSTMNRFRSKSRIALTGSPLANNLEEYYSIIEWIAPGYLGDRVEFRAKYVEPIKEGLWADSAAYEKRKCLKMLHALKRDLEPKIHRADASILLKRLPGKTEFVITVPLTKLQEDAYKIYVDFMLGESSHGEPQNATLWAWLSILRLLCNHPKCFRDKLVENKAGVQNDKPASKTKKKRQSGLGDTGIASDEESVLLDEPVDKLGIPKTMVDKELELLATVTGSLSASVLANKIRVLEQIMNYAEEAGDKTLIFSHSLLTLDYIEKLLRESGRKYSRLDGDTKISTRQQLTKDFNTGKYKMCLISTRAGGQGLNLYGANRVVIVDDHFNPMNEEQAIGRAYRIGQQKHVYVYRLTVGGTFEVALQNQSLFKQQLARRVVDKKNPMRHALKGVRQYLFYPKEVEQGDISGFFGRDPYVLDRILASQEGDPIVRSIALSETFHQEDNEELTVEEMNEADQEWRDQQLRRADPQAYHAMVATRSKAFTDMAAISAPFSTLQNLNPMAAPSTRTITPGTEVIRMAHPADMTAGLVGAQYQISNPARVAGAQVPSHNHANSPALLPIQSSAVDSTTLPKDLDKVFKVSGEKANGVSPVLRKSTGAGFLAIISRKTPSLAARNLYKTVAPKIGQDVCYVLAQVLEQRLNQRASSTDDYRKQIGHLNESLEEDVGLADMLRKVEIGMLREGSMSKETKDATEGKKRAIDSGPPSSLPPAVPPDRPQKASGSHISFVTEAEVIESISTAGVLVRDITQRFRRRIEDADVFYRWLMKNGRYDEKTKLLYPR